MKCDEWLSKLRDMCRFAVIACLLVLACGPMAQPAAAASPAPSGQALVTDALANELRAAQDQSHPMRYLLYKRSPQHSSTREIYETRDGFVSKLLSTNGRPLSPADQAKERQRLMALAATPSRQQHRKQAEDADRERVLKVLRAMPSAFLYQDEGEAQEDGETVERFGFRPNPDFAPQGFETEVLTAMAGELWIDPSWQRVVRVEGHLTRDVDFGWGLLGRLYKGGWIRIEQADVGAGQWRTVRLTMRMSGRVLWKPRVFDTVEEESQFAPLPASMDWQEAIKLLLNGQWGGRNGAGAATR